jgi:hypothetical protein
VERGFVQKAIDRLRNVGNRPEKVIDGLVEGKIEVPVASNVVEALARDYAFICEGPHAPQQGVAAGTIQAERFGLVRGSVTDRSGAPPVGARVVLKAHTELGFTHTDAAGEFVMAPRRRWVSVLVGGRIAPAFLKFSCLG